LPDFEAIAYEYAYLLDKDMVKLIDPDTFFKKSEL
jgi:hypothetical protein